MRGMLGYDENTHYHPYEYLDTVSLSDEIEWTLSRRRRMLGGSLPHDLCRLRGNTDSTATIIVVNQHTQNSHLLWDHGRPDMLGCGRRGKVIRVETSLSE